MPPLGAVYVHEAEMYAVIYALEYAQKFQWNILWIECDFAFVVSLLLKNAN